MSELITAYVGIRWESGMEGKTVFPLIFRLKKKTNWYFLCDCNYFTTLSNLAISECNHYWKRNVFAAPPPAQVHNCWTYQLGPLISVISLAVGNKGLI